MCIKAATYGLLFWLPYYIENHGMKDYKGSISAMFDIGNFFGGSVIGYITDRI